MQFKLRDMFLVGAMFCIATAALARIPPHHFIFPVALMTVMFVVIGQRKIAFLYGSCFLASWCLVFLTQLLVR